MPAQARKDFTGDIWVNADGSRAYTESIEPDFKWAGSYITTMSRWGQTFSPLVITTEV